MNTPTPYEQLMAAKLEQVPVPDMADSVWASIGIQLDTKGDAPDQADDTPDQGGNTPDKRSGPGFRGKGWFGFLGVVVVVATVWWYYNQKLIPAVKAPASVPAADSSTRINNLETVEKKNIPTAPIVAKKDTVQLQEPPAIVVRPNTATQEVLPLLKADSSSLNRDWVPVPFFDSLSVKPPGRKPRGVKGITSDDYKISAEKNHH